MKPIAPTDEDDLLAPLDIKGAVADLLVEKDLAYDRCLQGDSRQVYRIMYFARILQEYKRKYPRFFPDGSMDAIDVQVKQCARFEIEFNSDVTMTTVFASGNIYVQGQGMIVSYGMDGRLVQPAQIPLTHRRYNMNFPTGFSVVLSDGRLVLSDSYMRINRNRLDISTKMMPVAVWEHLIFCCPAPHEVANGHDWLTAFWFLHLSELITVDGYVFTPAHWKYTGNQILAEAIFERETPFMDGVATGNTWVVMLHKPGH